jgi:hypothetical protein
MKAAKLILEEEYSEAAKVIAFGAENGGYFVSQRHCQALVQRLKTSVDLGPLVEIFAELVHTTLLPWKSEEEERELPWQRKKSNGG